MGNLQPSDRRDEVGLRPGAALDRRDHDRGSGQRVAPQRHRRGAGVRALPDDSDLAAAGAADRRDHSDRAVFRLERRTLLDMDFDIADDFFRRANFARYARWIAPERGERLAARNPFRVALI
jgi:hypothetical protein